MAGALTVELGDRGYPVHVVEDELSGLGQALRSVVKAERVALVTDSNVGPLWAERATASLRGAGFGLSLHTLPAGEANKNLATWATLVDELLAAPVDRRTPVVALGGGVVGDMAGFAAAATLRGLPFVQVPTTLLAMVDSSVGGKTAVNHAAGKNLVGAFHQPKLVYADMRTLRTLPTDEVRAGLGEVVKTALLGDAAFFERLEKSAGALAGADVGALADVVRNCVRIKAAVVAEDEREAGVRAILNLGHTVAHGLERVLGYGALRHGEAVAIGLVAEARWAEAKGFCEAGVADRVAQLFGELGLAHEIPAVDRAAVAAAMRLDKKARATFVRVPVPTRVGETVQVSVSNDELHELLG
ncbi:MAG: 3-dehydroquinate synthase [Proteobacteria bacterium]|nr:3-dehydroquinate synthase [Pseudomonadota bacterium]